MSHIAAALFFTIVLLAASIAIHLTVRLHWAEIVLALKGELGLEVRKPAPSPHWAARPQPRRAVA